MSKKTSKKTLSKKFKASTGSNGQDRDEKDDNRRKQIANYNLSIKNVILLDSSSSFSPAEKVFFIDHIVELVFSKLGIQTLWKCRLVSRRWAHFGAKALQNVVNIRLYRRGLSYQEEDTIPVLFDLMNNSLEFPCNSFTFDTECFNKMEEPTRALEHFLNTHAYRIEKIGFEGYFYVENLKKIIFTHTQHVKQLVLSRVFFYSDDESKKNRESGSTSSSPQDIHGSGSRKAETRLERPAFKNLRVFISRSNIPQDIIRQILESSPNLVHVSMDQENLHCLVKPRNRLHLLTKLRILITDHNLDYLEVVANNHENNFAVKEFEFGGHGGYFDEPEPPKRLLEFLEKMLLGISATCTKMLLLNTLQNFQIPRMPQLKYLSFTYQENKSTGQPQKLLFQGGSLQDTFPILESLKIDQHSYGGWKPHPPITNIFGGRHRPLLPNVKKLTWLIPSPDDSKLQCFRQMFPNAVIHT